MADIIRAYGLRWKAENVYWKAAKRNGELLGVPARARSRKPTNFRDQVGVYVLFSAHRLVYVGQAGASSASLFGRLKTHNRDHLAGRWDTFSWFGLRYVKKDGTLSGGKQKASAPISTALNQMEAILIASTEPDYNKQGGRFGKGAVRYLQTRDDDRLGPTTDQMLRDIWNSLDEE